MKKIKIVLDSEFTGFNSGWPTRYIGLMLELYKYYQLSIFSPGNTSFLKKLFSGASICRATALEKQKSTSGFVKLIKNIFFPDRYGTLPGCMSYLSYYKEFHDIILYDQSSCDASIYFGEMGYIFYGENDASPFILCDFCDSVLRHLHNDLKTANNFREKVGIYYDMLLAKKNKRNFFSPEINIMAITEEDGAYIASVLKKNNVFIVPNGVNTLDINADDSFMKMKYKTPYIIFVGSLDYPPNEESILYSIEHLWPAINSKFPDMVFRIVGRSPTEKIKNAAVNAKGVDLIGPVKSTDEYYINAKCFLGPIFSGGGMKNKFLESVIAGTPVITTQEGVAGINFLSDKHGKIADTEENLIAETFELLSCSFDEYKKYVENCLVLGKEYSWESVGKLLCEIIKKNI